MGQAWWFIPVMPATPEEEVGGSWFEASPGQKCKTLSKKQRKAKSVRGMVQVVGWQLRLLVLRPQYCQKIH
jgi:hypothetical protein